jgi:hypothetical protein
MPLMRRLVSSERSERREFRPMSEQDEAEQSTVPGGKADSRVPGYIHRSALYFHALTEIWEYYRALGNEVPVEFKAEMARAEKIMIEDIRNEMGQGGALNSYYEEIKQEAERRRKQNEARSR